MSTEVKRKRKRKWQKYQRDRINSFHNGGSHFNKRGDIAMKSEDVYGGGELSIRRPAIIYRGRFYNGIKSPLGGLLTVNNRRGETLLGEAIWRRNTAAQAPERHPKLIVRPFPLPSLLPSLSKLVYRTIWVQSYMNKHYKLFYVYARTCWLKLGSLCVLLPFKVGSVCLLQSCSFFVNIFSWSF